MDLKIEKMYAYITLEGEQEGVIGFHSGMGWVPLVGADTDRAKSYRPVAQDIANRTGKEVKLIFFSQREEVEVIKPE